MNFAPVSESAPLAAQEAGNLVELRRYRLRPGARETLVDLFDREFVETQEAEGMRVIGQFRDLDDPDCFVWLRGFADMETRRRGLNDFYTGPVWARHRDIANGTMVNSDNVLLLRASRPGRGFPRAEGTRPAENSSKPGPGLLVATTCHLAPGTDAGFASLFEEGMRPVLEEAGAAVRASFVVERSPNSFPGLPVREGETVFVWFSSFAGLDAYEDHLAALHSSKGWTGEIFPEADRRMWRPAEIARLAPTFRSLLHG